MRLRFDPGDDEDYFETRASLLDELDAWLSLPDPERAGTVVDVGIFLDWRYRDSIGALDDFAPSDVTEFLLEWCPQRFKRHPNGAEFLCRAVGTYVEFMAATGRLAGGVDRAARLRQLADDLAPTVRAEMRDPTPEPDLFDGDDDERSDALRAAMDEIEQKYAPRPRSVDAPEPYELPFLYVAPPLAEVEAVVAVVPLLTKVDALRDYLGADGRQLTDMGNLKLADGRALIELLDTGDEMDPQVGSKTWRTGSTANLPRLNFILDVAKEIGAVRVHKRRLVAVKAWDKRAPLYRASALFEAIVLLGPSESHSSGRAWLLDEMAQLLDDGIVHWLAPLLADENEWPFDAVVEWARSVVDQQIARHWPDHRELLETLTLRNVSLIFQVLKEAGVVRWTHPLEVTEQFRRGYWTGGSVTLTALGRHVLPDYLDEAGYVLRRADDVTDVDGAALIEAMLAAPETQHEALVAKWQSNRVTAERAQMLTEAIVAATAAASRVMGFVALNMFDIEATEPLVRQLLDTPVAGHAALWLISRERADAATLGSFVDTGVLIDTLASELDDPERVCDFFADVSDPYGLLEDIWRHPAPETAAVLDALGSHLSEKALAKAARKAAIRHRSWMANH
jgi:hypothetical protein